MSLLDASIFMPVVALHARNMYADFTCRYKSARKKKGVDEGSAT